MENNTQKKSLFDVFLRLRPSSVVDRERFLDVERPDATADGETIAPTHITIHPPASDHRKRAIEKFAFTRVFEEHVGQREVFDKTGIVPLIEGVLGERGREGRDGLVATLGVTGSGKSHTILGSKSQRGITQLTLDVLFRHTAPYLIDLDASVSAFQTLCSADGAESTLLPAAHFLDSVYLGDHGGFSRAATPAMVRDPTLPSTLNSLPGLYPTLADLIPTGTTRSAVYDRLYPDLFKGPDWDGIFFPFFAAAGQACTIRSEYH